jgi:hypothetical protein
LTRTACGEYDGGVSELPEKKKRLYVTPRVLKVQSRLAGDNLTTGCKDGGAGGGPTENPCEAGGDPCQFADTS